MITKKLNIWWITALLLMPVDLYSQTTDPSSAYDEEDERSIRENPVIEGYGEDDIDISVPRYIKENRNHIILNGADWSKLRNALKQTDINPVNIVHIGDSHLQADIATGAIRDYLQYDYGNAGLCLVAPLRMSGTNEPRDYSISSPKSWTSAKLMKPNWDRTMGFTGTSISPVQPNSELIVSTSETDDYDPFSSITVFHNGQMFITGVENGDGDAIPFLATPSQNYTHIDITEETSRVKIQFESAGDLTVFGINLSGNRPGIFYHTIGNNGATYDTYNRIGDMGEGIKPLYPDLVIISLGTNEAFGRFDANVFKKSMNRLIGNITKDNPDAAILLVTPMECQRSVYQTVSKRTKAKGRGKKRRRTTSRRVRSYAKNNNILPIRNAILSYGKENHIAVYDWYEVAGGADASSNWISDGLFGRDRVHHTIKGYNLQGYLMYQALKEAFDRK